MARTKVPIELSSTPGIVDNSNATAITIDSSENVGIGTSSLSAGRHLTIGNATAPAQSFQQNGTEKFLFGVSGTVNGGVTGSASGDFFARTTGGKMLFSTDDGVTAHAVINSSGNVGIGTSSPSQKLETTGNIFINAASGNPDLTIKTAGAGNNPSVNYRAGNSIVFDNMLVASAATDYWRVGYGASGTVTNEYLAVTSAGNVGIGTTSPDTLLNLESATPTVRLAPTTQNNSSALELGVLNAGTTAYAKIDVTNTVNYDTNMRFFTNAPLSTTQVERMRIDSSGNLLVGTTSSTSIASHTPNIITSAQFGAVSGTDKATFGVDRIYFDASNYYILNASATGVKLVNGATSWTSQSDESLKENIVELTGVIDKIKDYRCVEYNLITDETKSKKIGFIAQDWQKDYDQIIDKDDDNNLGIRYTETIPVLLKAIQEQQVLIEELKTRIETLENI